jgi:hypothetical protein
MPFTKIEAKDYDGKGVTGLPDIPRLDTLDMQKKFDELAKDVAIPKHNVLVDELSGETAADNLGIADDIADFINPTKKIKPLLVTFAKKIKENSNDRHTHENKTVLDSITDTAIKAWNKVSNLFTNIDGVEDVVSGRTSKIPSSFAISQYVQKMGGGDMVQSIYDRNGNGIVDDAEALGGKEAGEYQTAESQELQTTSKSVVDAVNEVFNKTKDVLNTKEEIEGNTDPTAIAGALSVKELSNDLGNCKFGFTPDGKPGWKEKGADTVYPFKKAEDVAMFEFQMSNTQDIEITVTDNLGFKDVPNVIFVSAANSLTVDAIYNPYKTITTDAKTKVKLCAYATSQTIVYKAVSEIFPVITKDKVTIKSGYFRSGVGDKTVRMVVARFVS